MAETSDECVATSGCAGLSSGTFSWQSSLPQLSFLFDCPSNGCNRPSNPRLSISRVEIDLNDPANPVISGVSAGGLFDTGRGLRGVEGVGFSASDAGGGVATASVVVDGVERDSRVVGDAGGGCRVPYQLQQPCAAEVSPSYGFDTTQLADGRHDVTLLVRDATGVNTATYGPVNVLVDNAPVGGGANGSGDGTGGGAPGGSSGATGSGGGAGSAGAAPAAPSLGALPNGTNATVKARFAGAASSSRTVRHGSATTLKGRLVGEDGRAIAGARVDVLATVRRPKAKRATIGHATTTVTGDWAYRLKAGASRNVVVAYRAHAGDASYAATQKLIVLVRAGVRLSRSAKALHNGGLLTLTARVLGPEVRRRAAAISFQVKVGARWRTFGVTSIDAKGRARIRHRFRYTLHPVTYRFRARTVRSSSLPYVTGTSRVANVVVRP